MIVVDASAVVDLLIDASGSTEIRELLAAHDEVVAPAHIDAEVSKQLKRLERDGRMNALRAAEALDDHMGLVGDTSPLRPLLPMAWSLRHNLSMPDAFYVALSMALSIPLLTRDRRLAAAAEDHVEVLLV